MPIMMFLTAELMGVLLMPEPEPTSRGVMPAAGAAERAPLKTFERSLVWKGVEVAPLGALPTLRVMEVSRAGVARREYGVFGGKGDCQMLRVLLRFGFCSPGPGEKPGENFIDGEKL